MQMRSSQQDTSSFERHRNATKTRSVAAGRQWRESNEMMGPVEVLHKNNNYAAVSVHLHKGV